MPAHSTPDIRNVLFAGHQATGKTVLVESLLVHAKAIGKAGGATGKDLTCDYEAEEKHHGHSLKSAVVHLQHEGKLINLIDSPGSGDFIGHAVAAMAAVECVACFIDATKGIEVNTRRVMKVAAELGLPRMIVVSKIDHTEADLTGLIDDIHKTFGSECIPINLPIKNNTDVIDVFDHARPDGQPEPEIMTVEEAHQHILEQVVEMDEELTGEYFEKGDALDAVKLHRAMEAALRSGHLIPICFCSARSGAGLDDLLHIIANQMPSPQEASPPPLVGGGGNGGSEPFIPDTSTPDKPCVAYVWKVINDPFVGKLSVVRVLQGTLRHKTELLVGEVKKPVRINHIHKLRGKEHHEIEMLAAGDIGVLPKLEDVHVGSVLHADASMHLGPPRLPIPKPLYGIAVELKNHADEGKFASAVHKLAEEDPCFRMERVAATGQTVLRGLGELHLRVMLEKIKNRFSIDLVTKPMKVAYKETISARADGHHRHKKQTGGAGQFGEVYLRVAPLPLDHPEGFEFENATVGGSIPRQFMPAIEKGCRQVLQTGAIAGYPLGGVRVEVYDGKYHDVDSKEVAFVAAGKKAFIDAIAKARPVLLEPFVTIEVTAPAGKMGDITADLSGRRGRIESSDVDGDMCTVKAVAPLSELMNYSNELKSMTGGQGTYVLEYSHDDRVPPAIQQQVVAAYKPKAEEE